MLILRGRHHTASPKDRNNDDEDFLDIHKSQGADQE